MYKIPHSVHTSMRGNSQNIKVHEQEIKHSASQYTVQLTLDPSN